MNFSEKFDELAVAIKNKVESNKLDAQTVLNSMQNIFNQPQQAEITKESNDSVLSLISDNADITVKACDGKRTIAQAKKLFTGWLDSDFKNWGLDKPSQVTTDTKAVVYEMRKDADFERIFKSLNNNLDQLCWTQEQIIRFVEDNKNWLHPKGYATLFPFKCDDEYFVACVGWYSPELLRVRVGHFVSGDVWRAGNRNRVVVPATAVS